jgi:hypothetical protein
MRSNAAGPSAMRLLKERHQASKRGATVAFDPPVRSRTAATVGRLPSRSSASAARTTSISVRPGRPGPRGLRRSRWPGSIAGEAFRPFGR